MEAICGTRRRDDETFKVAQTYRMSETCGTYVHWSEIPSIFWQIAALSTGAGCFVAVIVAQVLLVSCCLRFVVTSKTATFFGLLQVGSGELRCSGDD